ncbi:MAG: carbon-nitrogen hydrolase family protein [Xanthomonadaceae bacterium]|nr:carbon-nitrogen hydrolase family protein [Xanthomonadaceae bacterium]
MTMRALVAAVQMVSGPEVGDNLAQAAALLEEAAAAGARLAVLPENFALLGSDEHDKLDIAETDGNGPVQAFLAEQARRHGIWLVGGSVPLRSEEAERVYSACLVYDSAGERRARYDKIHLFDVEVGAQEAYCESRTVKPGRLQPVLVDTPFGRLGLSICYDVRFPELFRRLVAEGMELLAIPSAFTATTGAAHWQTLVRARAIENQCFVIAPGQGGEHPGGRRTHGESMIVGPWGEMLARLDKGPGVALAEINLEALHHLRRRFPALTHRRF